MSKPEFQIVPIAEEHIAGFHAVVDSVARERRYLAMLQAFPLESTAEFVRSCLRAKSPHFVALVGGRVVGWCDIQPMPRETQAHGGVLGMGIDLRAKALYEKVGFVTEGVKRKAALHDGSYFDLVLMALLFEP